jgi:hypothetical protein
MSSIESNRCAECVEGLAHCHATLVIHIDGEVECLDSDCAEARETHLHASTCVDLHWVCPCQKVGDTLPLAA